MTAAYPAPDHLSIAVIGTSNTILKHGYVAGLRSSGRIDIAHTFALGESLGMLYALLTRNVSFQNYAACVIDFAVNEEMYTRWGNIPTAVPRDYLATFVCRLLADRCMPVLLMLPRRSVLASQSLMRPVYLEISAQFGVPFVDVIGLVETISCRSNIDRTLLFKDDGHLHEWFSYAVGQQLASVLERLPSSPSRGTTTVATHKYEVLPASSFLNISDNMVRRETSLLKMEFGTPVPGVPVSVSLPFNSEVAGVYLNLARSAGRLQLIGTTAMDVDFRSAYLDQSKTMIASVLALPRSISAKSGAITLVVPRASDATPPGMEQYVAIPHAVKPPDAGMVELGGLILRQPLDNPHSVAALTYESCDLSTSFDKDVLVFVAMKNIKL